MYMCLHDRVQTCTVNTIWYFMCSPTSELNTKGFWVVTEHKMDQGIYPGYAERFCQSFPTQVCVECNYEASIERSCCDETCNCRPHKKVGCVFAKGASTGQ